MKEMVLKIINIYQKLISPTLHSIRSNWGCRFYPTCSVYSCQAIGKYGLLRGLLKTLKRIIRCNPFNKGGYDPC